MLMVLESTNKRGKIWVNPKHITHVTPLGGAPDRESVVHFVGGAEEHVMGHADNVASQLSGQT